MNVFTLEAQESRQYAKGKRVELKNAPGRIYVIESYDEMMIPPIWLENDPVPHYAHELVLQTSSSYHLIPQVA